MFLQTNRQYKTIHTPRCTLQLMGQQFAKDILQTCTIDVCEYFDHPIHQTIDEVEKQISDRQREYKEKKCINLAIINEKEEFVGNTEVRHIDTGNLSMGIWLGMKYHKQGYGLEVIQNLLTRINQHLVYEHIKRECYKANTGSIAIAHEIGAILYETKKTHNWKYGEIDDCVYHIYPSK